MSAHGSAEDLRRRAQVLREQASSRNRLLAEHIIRLAEDLEARAEEMEVKPGAQILMFRRR